MPEEVKEFSCKPGECIKCCTYDGLLVPVTLGDLYRALVYERKVEGKRKQFYSVFEERCSSFAIAPAFNDPSKHIVTIKSKMPCHNVDSDNRVCAVHGKVQYVGCGLCPEERLLPEDKAFERNEDPKTVEFFAQLECLKDVTLTPERAESVREIRNLASDEMMMTSKLLSYGLDLRKMKPKRFQREVKNRMKFISSSAMKKLWQNVRQTMQRYVDLYVDDHDFGELLLDYFK